jgi:hypothetical protein
MLRELAHGIRWEAIHPPLTSRVTATPRKFKRAGRSANRHAPGAQRPPPLKAGWNVADYATRNRTLDDEMLHP